jgi:hypothetical protein
MESVSVVNYELKEIQKLLIYQKNHIPSPLWGEGV